MYIPVGSFFWSLRTLYCMWHNQHSKHQLCFLFFVVEPRYFHGNLQLSFVEKIQEFAEHQQKLNENEPWRRAKDKTRTLQALWPQ